MRVFSSSILIFLLAASSAAAAGDADAGHELAARWCTGCHIIDASRQGSDAAPPFPAIARNKGGAGWLRAWLAAPHPPMPNFNLSRRQIDDIVAYLDSLPRH